MFERVETSRLVLRKPLPADAEAIFARYASDAEVTRMLGWQRHVSLDDTQAFLEFSNSEWARWRVGPYLIESRQDSTVLGGTGLDFETPERASTGYVLARDAWGNGYATEALRAVVDVAGKVGVVRLYALCHTDNKASSRVLEKCGFLLEEMRRRHLRFPNLDQSEPADVYCYVR